MNTSTAGYIRVSTEEQATSGVSLEAQEQRVRAYCAMRDLNLRYIIIDPGISASKPLATRPGGARLLSLVRAREINTVIAVKLDRLFRDCTDCLITVRNWEQKNIALHLLDLGGQAVDTSSAIGRFFLTVMAGVSELERNQLRERTVAAMQHLKRTGKYTGGNVLYGYKVGPEGVLEPEANEQDVLSYMKSLREAGCSIREVTTLLASERVFNRADRPFGFEQVRQLIMRLEKDNDRE